MRKIFIGFLISLIISLAFLIQPVTAKQIKTDTNSSVVLVCFSGGQEIIRKTVIAGPFADEYKFAHEVKVIDERGEYQLNFSGGLCVIDQGQVSVKKQLNLTDRLSCYSGATKVIDFDVYGEETTIDEYVEGRTFLAKNNQNSVNSDSLHRYLIFGGGACIGEETQ
jgi:hypothetical protein